MNNNKNSYVLALQVLNTHRRKYYEQDLPQLSDVSLPEARRMFFIPAVSRQLIIFGFYTFRTCKLWTRVGSRA